LKKPNFLLIVADQLSQRALGAYGNPQGSTPRLDQLAARGVRFTNSYTPCPLCQPARAAFWTGRFPHATGVLSNGWKHPVPPVSADLPTLGELMSRAGYDAVHFGKEHDAGSLRGFRLVKGGELPVEQVGPWPVGRGTQRDRDTTERVMAYLRGGPLTPFLAVADLNNPHDICPYVGAFAGPHEDPPIPGALPPLPENFRVADFTRLPRPIQYICCSHNRQAQAAGWNETNYRHYLAAYHHYVGRVDAEIGKILDALSSTLAGRDTIVIFFADHGDGMGGRGLVTKQVSFYDETTRVPLIVAGPGIAGPVGRPVDGLVSLLDLLPTICEMAGVAPPEGLWGRSLVPWLRRPTDGDPHEAVVAEWHTEWGVTVEPGRMLRTQRFKYTCYREEQGEELYDLREDPGETRNLVAEPSARETLERHRRLLRDHLDRTADPFASLTPLVDARWRSHPPGHIHHRGPSAPMEARARETKG